MPVFLFADNARSTLAAGIGPTSTTITLAAGTGALFPNPAAGQQFAVTFNDLATRLIFEVAYCTHRAGDVLTLLRGQEGTTARSWQIGDYTWNGPTSGQMAAMVQLPRMTDGSISPVFGPTTVQGALIVSLTATVSGLVNNGPSTLNGNVTTSGNLTAAGNLQGFNVTATNAVIAGTSVQTSDVIASHNITAASDISAGHNVSATNLVHSTGNVTAQVDVTAGRDVDATRDINAGHNVTAGNLVWSATQVWANNGNVTANQGSLVATYDVSGRHFIATGNITAAFVHSLGNIQADGSYTGGNVSVSGNITGAYVGSTGNINAAGTYTGGNVSVSTDIYAGRNASVVGTFYAGGNINTPVDIGARSVYCTTQFYGPYVVSTGNMYAGGSYTGGNVSVSGTVQGAYLYSTGSITAALDIVANRNMAVAGSFSANSVGANYIASTNDIHATGTFTGGGVSVTGAVTGGWLTSTGGMNVAGNGDVSGTMYAGALYSRGPVYVGNTADFYLNVSGNARNLQFAGNWYWGWDAGNGYLSWVRNGNVMLQLTGDGQLIYYGSPAYKYGNGSWFGISDGRVKDVGDEYQGGLNEVRNLIPRHYTYRTDMAPDNVEVPSEGFIGLTAQEAEVHMPELIRAAPAGFAKKIPNLRAMDTTPLFYAMLNAIKELDREVQSLKDQLATKGGQ